MRVSKSDGTVTDIKGEDQTPLYDSSAEFFDRVMNHPLLSASKERDLARRAKRGDRAAREELIRCNMKLVASVAAEFRHYGLEMDDLFQEGVIGLGKAIDKFNPELGYKLSTYAIWWIRQTVMRAAANKSHTIRAPIGAQYRRYLVQQHISQNPGASDDEVADALGIRPDQVGGALAIPQASVSLDHEREGDESTPWDEVLLDADAVDPEGAAVREMEAVPVREAVDALPEPMRSVIRLRFGIGESHPRSIVEVGEALDIPGHRVSALQKDGLAMLKEALVEV